MLFSQHDRFRAPCHSFSSPAQPSSTKPSSQAQPSSSFQANQAPIKLLSSSAFQKPLNSSCVCVKLLCQAALPPPIAPMITSVPSVVSAQYSRYSPTLPCTFAAPKFAGSGLRKNDSLVLQSSCHSRLLYTRRQKVGQHVSRPLPLHLYFSTWLPVLPEVSMLFLSCLSIWIILPMLRCL